VNLEHQIKVYEECITRLEKCRQSGSGDCSRLDREIENAYQQIALLKIRQSMDIAT